MQQIKEFVTNLRTAIGEWITPQRRYIDSLQISITCSGTFTREDFRNFRSYIEEDSDKLLPHIVGSTRLYKDFKPTRAILTELVTATWSAEGLPDVEIHESVQDASDLVLFQAFAGAECCFPISDRGIAGSVFSPVSTGVCISWPVIRSGLDVNIVLAVEQSVLSRTRTNARDESSICTLSPEYGFLPKSVHVKARLNLIGPILR